MKNLSQSVKKEILEIQSKKEVTKKNYSIFEIVIIFFATMYFVSHILISVFN